MSDTDISSIEQKKKEMSRDDSPKNSDWIAFAYATLYNLIITLVFGLIGANFIFLTAFADLNKFFTTERFPNYFPNAEYINTKGQDGVKCSGPTKRGGGTGANETNKTNNKNAPDFNYDLLEKVGIGKNGGWPYSMAKKPTETHHLYQKFKNWFSFSVCDTFILNKEIFKKWLGFFNPKKKYLSDQTFQMIVVAPLTLFLGMFLSMILGFGGYVYHSFESNWIFALIGLFFGYTMFFSAMTSSVNFFKFLGAFLLVPLISNIEIIGDILKNNSNVLAMLFGALTLSSAFATLDYSISITMMIVYIILIIKNVFF